MADRGFATAGAAERTPEPPPAGATGRVRPLSVVEADVRSSPGFALRIGVLVAIATAAFAALGLRLWSLAVIQAPRYRALAAAQAARVERLQGPRGAIVDRAGRLLAGAQGRLAVEVDPAALGHARPGRGWRPSPRGRAVLRRLAAAAGMPTSRLEARVARHQTLEPWLPAVVVPRAPAFLAAYVAERRRELPGVRLVVLPDRRYPQGGLGAEFLGLLGEIDAVRLRALHDAGYRAGDVVGRSGVEAVYDRLLRSRPGLERVAVDARGQPAGPARVVRRAGAPHGLRLTIDARLQRTAVRAIRHGIALARAHGHADARAGAAVALDPRTGAVYALASYPSFNEVRAAHDPAYLARLLRSPAGLLDRATQGLYPLGSTFKPVVAEAALASGLLAPGSALLCDPALRVGDVVFHNVESGVYAYMTLPEALAVSCDTWFYRLGLAFYERQARSGRLDLQRWARALGLGARTGIDLPGEAAGVVPTPGWLRRSFSDPWLRIWYPGTSVNLSIGQGYLTATPLQLAVAYAALANGGTVVRPHVAAAVLDAQGNVVRRLAFPPRRRLHLTGLGAIRAGLYAAAHTGTSASTFASFPVPVAGKTGTAEAPHGSSHSWYASWAPSDRPRLVVVVLIEHGGFGAEAAAPAARDIYAAFFGRGAQVTEASRGALPAGR